MQPTKQLQQSISLKWIAYGAIALAICLRIIYLASRELWYDEVLALLLSTGQKIAYEHPQDAPVVLADYLPLLSLPSESTMGDVLNTGKNFLKGLVAEPHPPLFFLGQHLWLRLFGNSEAAMRSLGVWFSIGAMGSAYGLGRCLLGHRVGLLLAALLGLNPYYFFHSLNVRMYCPLVFWAILSAWALLELIQRSLPELGDLEGKEFEKRLNQQPPHPKVKAKLLWNLIFIGSITGGLMTFYYFAYWLTALVVLVLWLDRKHWWQHALRFVTGILITIPWVLWGTTQQMRNADLGRFAASSSWLEATLRHLQGLTQTLGINLILGDWVTSLPPGSATVAGIVAIAVLVGCSVSLWRQHQRRLLGIALLLGIFPLLLMLAVDIITGKFTVGFGWGRSAIFILPGCLLLLTVWLEKTSRPRKRALATGLLLLYLTVSVADFSLRPRWIFHQVAHIINQEPTAPTLIVMNSQAWGHVLRLAYYLPPKSPVMLLAQKSGKLAPVLAQTLAVAGDRYQRLIWLDSDRPVWGSANTEAEKKHLQQLLSREFDLQQTQQLSGTSELDSFTVRLYQQRPNPNSSQSL